MTIRLALEWFSVLALLGFATYTLLVIKNEKRNFLKEGVVLQFKHFNFLIPKWWGQVETQDENQIKFMRLDTRYEWHATFNWVPSLPVHSIDQELRNIIEKKKILFDEDTTIINMPSEFKNNPTFQNSDIEMIRIEGTATEDREHRLYYDAFLIFDKKRQGMLYCESRSSVLNGLVEGPYFEEVMLRMQMS